MLTFKKLVVILICTISTFSSSAQSKFENWPEMANYTTLFTEAWKAAQDGNLKVIRTRSHELLADIKLVTATPIPPHCNSDEMKHHLKKLQKDTDKLNSFIVLQEDASSIMKQMKTVHASWAAVEEEFKNYKSHQSTK